MFGPLFRYELTRLARRGLQPRLRAAFAALLLLVLLLAYLAAFPGVRPWQLLTRIDEPLTTESASRFGERLVVAFLLVQAAVVVLVTPVVVVGAIGDDKDRRALDALLATPLSDAEIVAGKLAARLVFVGALLLTGLPVVALSVFFGGVDVSQLVAGYAIALLTMLSLGAFSLFLAVSEPTAGGALFRAYFFAGTLSVVGFLCSCVWFPALLSPFGMTWVILHGWPGVFVGSPANLTRVVTFYALVHLLLTMLFCLAACRWLRNPKSVSRLVVILNLPAPRGGDDQPPRVPELIAVPFRVHNVPSVGDTDPLDWKERYFGGWASANADVALALFAIAVVPLTLLLVLARPEVADGWSSVAVLLAGLTAIAAVGFRAASCVARERQQGTLDSLLALPVTRRDILFAKAKGAASLAGWPAALALVAVCLGVIRGVVVWPAIVGVPLILAGWVTGVVGLGMWLSVRCPTRQRAVAWLLVIGVTASVVMPLLGTVVDSLGMPPPDGVSYLIRGFSPIDSLWHATPREERFLRTTGIHIYGSYRSFGSYVLAAVLVGALGVLFYQRACREFERKVG
jgi:ABC-type transport system involved in multi-copper enzyme maturation permease subunit